MPPVAAPSDKRFRRAQVKPARRRSLTARHTWLAVRVVAMLALALYGGWRGTTVVLGAPALQVSRISVSGNQRLSSGEVLALLDGLRGRNIIALDLDEWQQRLLASAWVQEAHVRRVLPSRVDVEIRERHPMGIGRLSGGLYLVDPHGVVIDEYGPNYADLDLPLIDGLAGPPGKNSGVIDERRARLADRVLQALETRPDLAERISQVDVRDVHDAVILLDDETTLVRLGEDAFVERIQEYLDLAPALRERVPEIDYVDLRFRDRVYVRPVP